MSQSDSSNSPKNRPYQQLGLRLRDMRKKFKESAAEVSGAVEIDVTMLERFESGIELPSEDILMLLINHFGLGDDEAVSLWELAGYDQFDGMYDDNQGRGHDEARMSKQPVIVFALDSRIVYTNGAEVVTDQNGVVVNFSQMTDTKQGPVQVARVGMSYEQAEQVMKSMQQAILRGKFSPKTKQLPAPRPSAKDDKRHKRRQND